MATVIDLLRAAGVECFTRAEWGSPRERDGSYARRARTHPIDHVADYHFLHLSVTSDTDTVAEGAAGARQIEGYGYSTPPMVSYQMLTTNEGRAFEGQSYGVKGTHTVNDKKIPRFPDDLNRHGYAVALMQNEGDEVSDAQVQVTAMCFAAAELAGHVRRGAPIYPHRKFAYKACPGDRAMARLPEIQRLKDQYVAHGLPNQKETVMSWSESLHEWYPGDPDKADQMRAGQQLGQARGYAQEAWRHAKAANARTARLEKALAALAAGLGPAVQAAVAAALDEKLPEVIDVRVDVSVPNKTT